MLEMQKCDSESKMLYFADGWQFGGEYVVEKNVLCKLDRGAAFIEAGRGMVDQSRPERLLRSNLNWLYAAPSRIHKAGLGVFSNGVFQPQMELVPKGVSVLEGLRKPPSHFYFALLVLRHILL